MTIRYLPAVRDPLYPKTIDPAVWRGLVTAHMPIGRCDECGGDAYGEPITRSTRYGVPPFANASCAGCGDQAAYPVRTPQPIAA
jgi:hypothetical protein